MNLLGLAAIPVEYRNVAADSSVVLLVGGLAILTLIIVLVLLQNLIPAPASAAPHPENMPSERQLRPLMAPAATSSQLGTETMRDRRRRRVPPTELDIALDRIVEAHLGEPRILMRVQRFAQVRLYFCRGCRGRAPGDGGPQDCGFERGAFEREIQAVLGSPVAVREVTCQCRGAPFCDFEVRY